MKRLLRKIADDGRIGDEIVFVDKYYGGEEQVFGKKPDNLYIFEPNMNSQYKKSIMEKMIKENEEYDKLNANILKGKSPLNVKQRKTFNKILNEYSDPDHIRSILRKKKSAKSKVKRCKCK